MVTVLILYPKAFNCYSKFSRKVKKITLSLGRVIFVYPDDPNGFIQKVCDEIPEQAASRSLTDWNIDDVTHAIIFDDGEEFTEQTTRLKSSGKPLRLINISITRVINIRKHPEYQAEKSTSDYEYIGRGSCWGNPYSVYDVEDLEDGEDPRELVISNYKYDFEYGNWFKLNIEKVYKLAGKRLGCFCKPKPCHGDVLADFLNSWDDGK